MKVKFLDNVAVGGQRYLAGHEADINFNMAEHLKARGLVEFEKTEVEAEPKATTQKTAAKTSAKKAVK